MKGLESLVTISLSIAACGFAQASGDPGRSPAQWLLAIEKQAAAGPVLSIHPEKMNGEEK